MAIKNNSNIKNRIHIPIPVTSQCNLAATLAPNTLLLYFLKSLLGTDIYEENNKKRWTIFVPAFFHLSHSAVEASGLVSIQEWKLLILYTILFWSSFVRN